MKGREPPLLLFDLDGTLIDSVADIHAAAERTAAFFGSALVSLEAVRSAVGDGARAFIERVFRPHGEAEATALHNRFLGEYEAEPALRTRPYPGIDDMLGRIAAAALPMAVVTNKPEGLACSVVASLGWSELFPVVIGGDTCRRRKPDPEPLLAARDRMGHSGHQMIVIGDGPQDMGAARAAGATGIWVSWGLCRSRPPGADHVADQPSEVLDVLGLFSEIP